MIASHDPNHDQVRWLKVADAEALRHEAVQRICDAAAEAIAQRSQFLIVLAGGNTPRDIYHLLRDADTDWSRWHVYFGDERCLATDHAERNSRMAAEVWLTHVPIPPTQIHAIPAERGAAAAALAYTATLKEVGEFDLVLLGLGEDGHTASLFSGQGCTAEASAPDAVAVFDAPKPPAQRVSLSATRLSRTRAALFLVEGEAKRHAVAQWHAAADIPARSIRPAAGVDVLITSSLLEPSADFGLPF